MPLTRQLLVLLLLGSATLAAEPPRPEEVEPLGKPRELPAVAPSGHDCQSTLGPDRIRELQQHLTKDAFAHSPTVELLVPRNGAPPVDADLFEQWAVKAKQFTQPYYFPTAAHFPLPRFGAQCEVLALEGVIIHEGMRILAARNGHYEVRLTVSAPPMPVAIRLQLALETGVGAPPIVLTLPPMRVGHERPDEATYLRQSWQLSHIGYSDLLRERLQAGHPGITGASRHGTARFGGFPAP